MSEENKKETAPKAVETPKVEEVVVAETPVTEEVEAAPVLEEVKAEKSPKKKVEKVEQPKEEITKLALNTEGGIINLEITTFEYKLNCLSCHKQIEIPEKFKDLVKSIEEHESAYKKAID